jgi:hypothetical protein
MANVTDFIAALKEGGARANQFEVNITGAPVGIPQEFRFLCKASSIPALTVPEIEVNYRGRKIYVAGDRTYDTWGITVVSDRDQMMRGAFEDWQNHLSDLGAISNRTGIGDTPSRYYADAIVKQKDRNDNTLRTYKLIDVWPTTVDAIEFSHDTENTILEFGVTFRFNYMQAMGGSTGQLGVSGGSG